METEARRGQEMVGEKRKRKSYKKREKKELKEQRKKTVEEQMMQVSDGQ